MIIKDLKLPQNLRHEDIYKGPDISHIERLEIMSPSKFEELTEIWLLSKEHNIYEKVKRNAGPGDKGRDIVGYHFSSSDIDIYQCKHYKDPLSWSDIREEFYKLCYFTFVDEYKTPNKYYIVSSKGCSTKLRTDYLDKPQNINKALIAYLNKNQVKVDNRIINNLDDLRRYIESFDFSIVKEITPSELIEEFWDSKYRPYYFGGGLKKFEKVLISVPQKIMEEEKEYISRLLDVYSEKEQLHFDSHVSLDKKYSKHFETQRTYFYSIESFRRCVRDNLPSMEPFEEVEETIHQGINDIICDPFSDGYEKLSNSLSRSVEMNMDNCVLKTQLCPNDKRGVCHRLANKKKVRWVDNE